MKNEKDKFNKFNKINKIMDFFIILGWIIAVFSVAMYLIKNVSATSHPCHEPCKFTRDGLLAWGVPADKVDWTLQKGEQIKAPNGTVIPLSIALKTLEGREERILKRFNELKSCPGGWINCR